MSEETEERLRGAPQTLVADFAGGNRETGSAADALERYVWDRVTACLVAAEFNDDVEEDNSGDKSWAILVTGVAAGVMSPLLLLLGAWLCCCCYCNGNGRRRPARRGSGAEEDLEMGPRVEFPPEEMEEEQERGGVPSLGCNFPVVRF